MGEQDIFKNTLEKFVKNEMTLPEHEEISWDYFQEAYKKMAALGFTEIITLEELDQASILKDIAKTLTKSGNLPLAMAILWQMVVVLFALNSLEDAGKAREDLAEGIAQGSVYVNWPWGDMNSSTMLYPLTFAGSEEKYILLVEDGERGYKLYISSGLPDSSNIIERFAWTGLKEVRFTAGDVELQSSVCLGTLSCQKLAIVRALESFLTTACVVELMYLAIKAGFKYSNERVQFGQKIWDFQVLKHYLADAYSKYQITNIALDELTEYFSSINEISEEIEEIKQVAFSFLQEITDISLQMHGGNGYMREFPIQRFWRDGMLLKLYCH